MASKMKQQRRKKLTPGKRSSSVPAYSFGKSYNAQQRCSLTLETAPVVCSAAVTTGLVQINLGSSPPDLVADWATRFANTFDEYRVLAVRYHLESLGPSTGITRVWFEEKNVNLPTFEESRQQTILSSLKNTNAVQQRTSWHWEARDLLDLEFVDISVTKNPVFFQVYSDATNYGAPIVATPLWLLHAELLIEFKGINAEN